MKKKVILPSLNDIATSHRNMSQASELSKMGKPYLESVGMYGMDKQMEEFGMVFMSGDQEKILDRLSRAKYMFMNGFVMMPEPNSEFLETLIPLIHSDAAEIADKAMAFVMNIFANFQSAREQFLDEELLVELFSNISNSDNVQALTSLLKKNTELVEAAFSQGVVDRLLLLLQSDNMCLVSDTICLLLFIYKQQESNESLSAFDTSYVEATCNLIQNHFVVQSDATYAALTFLHGTLMISFPILFASGHIARLIAMSPEMYCYSLTEALSIFNETINEETVEYYIQNNIFEMLHFLFEKNSEIVSAINIIATLITFSKPAVITVISNPIGDDIISSINLNFQTKIASFKVLITLYNYIDNSYVSAFLLQENVDMIGLMTDILSSEFNSETINILNYFIVFIEQSKLGKFPFSAQLNLALASSEFIQSLECIITYQGNTEAEIEASSLGAKILDIVKQITE